MEDKEKKPRKVNVHFIPRPKTGEDPNPIYGMLDRLIGENHQHLADADVGLAWHDGWTPDADGHLRLGQARKCSDLERDIHGLDFVITLNRTAWMAADFSQAQMLALIDHELCHCGRAVDKETGEPAEDEQGRPVWRIIKHDLEEFRGIVERHGCWLAQIEEFARAALASKAQPAPEEED